MAPPINVQDWYGDRHTCQIASGALALLCVFWYCVLAITESCFVFHCTVVITVWWYCGGRPNRELWPRLVTVQWIELWHVNSLRSLCCHRQETKVGHEIQELSYRQQIARKLRTRYAEGIYRHKYYTVTLKSRLSVTRGHWKRNHWIDHTWLRSSRVIWRWILLWPWNMGSRSLKVIESGNIWKFGFLFAFHSNYGRICSCLWDIQCQRMAWPWKPG